MEIVITLKQISDHPNQKFTLSFGQKTNGMADATDAERTAARRFMDIMDDVGLRVCAEMGGTYVQLGKPENG